jgi:hypothetical protein
MKKLKNRGNLYLVQRLLFHEGFPSYCVVGCFSTLEGADAYMGACYQEFLEKGFDEDDVVFSVVLSSYYDA